MCHHCIPKGTSSQVETLPQSSMAGQQVFSPGSHLPGLSILSVMTNIKKPNQIKLKDTGWRRKLIPCHQELHYLFVTAGLLRATDKKNKT